jgi:hypothetical protein
LKCGWEAGDCIDMTKAYMRMPLRERQRLVSFSVDVVMSFLISVLRIQQLESLDEFEEFNLMLSHYSLWWGVSFIELSSVGPGVNTDDFTLRP